MPATFLVDLETAALGEVSLAPAAAIIASTNGTGVDLLDAEGPVHAVVVSGATDFTTTDETYSYKLQESDTSGGTYTDIPGATGSVTEANSVVFIGDGSLRTKRYVRVVATLAGTTPSTIVGAAVVARKKITGTGNGAQTS